MSEKADTVSKFSSKSLLSIVPPILSLVLLIFRYVSDFNNLNVLIALFFLGLLLAFIGFIWNFLNLKRSISIIYSIIGLVVSIFILGIHLLEFIIFYILVESFRLG